MNKAFYGLAIIVALALIIVGLKSSRDSKSDTNSNDSNNIEQLQDAAQKAPAE